MPAYIVATFTVSKRPQFDAYVEAVRGLREIFGGESLMRGLVIETLEGGAPEGEHVAVLRFPDVHSARAYIASPQYQAGKKLRQGAADVTLRLVEV